LVFWFVLAIVVSVSSIIIRNKKKNSRFSQIIQDLKAHKNSEIHKSEISVSAFEVQSNKILMMNLLRN
jgi:hypothetical protein